MIVLDVNVLLAAHRADHPDHHVVRPWFDELLASDEAFSVPDLVWVGLVRITTNRRIFVSPTPVGDAFAFVHAVRAQPGYATLAVGERQLLLFEDLCREADATGDLTPDAYLAALAVGHGCELASLDRDFARFERLRWRIPGRQAG